MPFTQELWKGSQLKAKRDDSTTTETQPLLEDIVTEDNGQSPKGELSRWTLFRRSQRFKLIVVSTALFTDNFLYGVIVPTLPYDLPKRSGVSVSDVEFWTSNLLAAYGLSSLIAAPVLGAIAERTSNRKAPLIIGLMFMSAATLIYGFMKDVRALFVARILQGLSAAIVYTSGLAFLVDYVDPESIGTYMGAALSAENMGLMISPLIGGPVYAHLGRKALIGLMIGLLVLDIGMRLIVVDDPIAVEMKASGSAHTVGSDVEAVQESIPSSSLAQRQRRNSLSEGRRSSIVSGPVSALGLLKNPRILSAAYGLFLGQVLLTTFDGVLPRFTQRTYHWGPAAAGLVFLALSLPSLFAALAGTLSDTYGPKWVTFAGFALAAPAYLAVGFMEKRDVAHEILLCVFLALIGLAVGFITTPLAADMALVVEKEIKSRGRVGSSTPTGTETGSSAGDNGYGQVFSILLFAQCAGILAGPSWAGFAYKELGWLVMAVSLAALSASALIPTVGVV